MRTWGIIPIAKSVNPASAIGGVNTSTSTAATVISGGTAHTKGAWVELFASTAFNTTWLDLIVMGTANSGANRHMLCDVGIGPAGSETVLIPNVAIGCAGGIRRYPIPIWVPAGTRIAVRYQTLTTSHPITLQIAIHNTGHLQSDTGNGAIACGVNTATSSGTALALAGAINTLSAWTEITASTSAAIRSLLVTTQGPLSASWADNASVLIDVGYGASGAEQVLISGLPMGWGTTEMTDSTPLILPVNLPSGTRLVGRYQSTHINQAPTMAMLGIS